MPPNQAVALVSGGIDSPVAVARMVASGWDVNPVHCSLEPVTGNHAEVKTIKALRHLRSRSGPLAGSPGSIADSLLVITVGPTLAGFTDGEMHRDYFVHMKRLYHAIASRICDDINASHLLTGENLGQVSSQTLGNLGACEIAANRPILRPLLGFDKQRIIGLARDLGTYEISTGPEVCDALGPKRPSTVADRGRLLKHEKELGGLMVLVEECLSTKRVVSLSVS